ncbi:MAG: L,D-transpeptidase family protein [Rhodospirillales bacterium]
MADLHVFSNGILITGGERYRCALGSGGIVNAKSEGDGGTPAGSFPLRRVHYRADRRAAPATDLPVREIAPQDGWCDDPAHEAYNTLVTLPLAAGHEVMTRDDALYDVVVEIGYNDDPPVPGAGSAIFMHVARPGYAPTEGCVALAPADIDTVLKTLDPASRIHIYKVAAPDIQVENLLD